MTGWPAQLWLVRHGESEGNLANARAAEALAERLDLEINDIEVPLSELGRRQAASLGAWLRDVDAAEQPTAVVCSPYVRAHDTAQIVLREAGLDAVPLRIDERLRDREQGVLDRLTRVGIERTYPEEAQRRAYVGKFWYRPAGGESWADVAGRVRAALTDLRLDYAGERVLIVSHDVPIVLARYVLEGLSYGDALKLSGEVANCSVSRFVDGEAGRLRLERWNDVEPLAEHDEPVTARD